MPFLAPLALAGLLLVPVVLAMYLLRLRRDERVVPSTLLWRRLGPDVEANAPWQRLRRSLLLLLQLLLVVVLALLAARPVAERPAGLARDLVVVVDASASMQATDEVPNRLEAAKALASEALRDLPAGGTVSVVAAGRTARVVANATADLGAAREAIASIEASADVGDLGDALRLASALAARSVDAEILVATDAALAAPPEGALDAPVRVLRVGRSGENQAIVALAVRAAPSGLGHSAFVSVANLGSELVTRRLEIWADGVLRDSRSLVLDPQRRTDVAIEEVDDPAAPAAVVEVRLAREEGGSADLLAVDDRAWAVVPPARLRTILLVGEGDPYLETALTLLPETELYGVTPGEYGPATKVELFDLVILQGWLPAELPAMPILAIDPPRSSPLGIVDGTLTTPGIGTLDAADPLLRHVDLTTLHVADARRLELPGWARAVIPGPGGAPLLHAGVLDGRPAAVLAFDPRRSDLPLQVAFPILLANLTGELLGGSAAPVEAVVPGAPVTLPIPAGATGLRVELPDGSVDELAAPAPGAASVTFARTGLPGVYTVRPVGATGLPGASPSGAGGAGRSPGADPSGSPGAGAIPAPADPSAPVRFAVALLDVDEARIAPGNPGVLTGLGRPEPSAAPGSGAGGGAAERPAARDELWIPIVILALLLLTAEWLLYERDTVARLRRALAARLGRGIGGSA